MNTFDRTKLNGYPLNMRMISFMWDNWELATNTLAEIGGDDCILWGVQHVGSNVTKGAIIYNGELLKFNAGVWQATFLIVDTPEASVTFGDLSSQDIYTERHAECGVGAGQIDMTDLSRTPFAQREWQDFFSYQAGWTNIDLQYDVDSRGKYYIRGSIQRTGGNIPGPINTEIGSIISGAALIVNEFYVPDVALNDSRVLYGTFINKVSSDTHTLNVNVLATDIVTNDIFYFQQEFYLKA